MGKMYWTINSRWQVANVPKGTVKFPERKKVGNIFATKEEAQALADYIKTLKVEKTTTYIVKPKVRGR